MTSAAPPGALAPKAPTSDARTRLGLYLRRPSGLVLTDPDQARVEPLVQEAGERVYFRIRPGGPARRWPAAAEGRSVVVCVMADPYEPGTLPFANSTELYGELGVRAPRVLEEAPHLGVLALEDLGDELLQLVALRGGADVAAHYDEAVGIIARIQREGARLAATRRGGRFRAFSTRLDGELFRRELLFFARHFLTDLAGLDLTGAAGRELGNLFTALAEEAAGGPEALAHRDFHSRNLIARHPGASASPVPPRHLYVIDHQDSRVGPRVYDLMSLARDPYVAGNGGARMPFRDQDLIDHFLDAAGWRESPEELLPECDAVALQRNLKALGTYGFQIVRRRNEVYRRYLAPTMRMVMDNLSRHHERADRRRLRAYLADVATDPA